MKNKKVSVFLPTRKGSERVKNKNTRQFANFKGGLLELKLKQLIKVLSVNEIILSTNDEHSLEVAQEILKESDKLKIIHRPNNLALSTTSLIDLVKYVSEVCTSEHLLWTHVTSPFVTHLDYEKAIFKYFEELENGYDSLMSVKSFKGFLWDEKDNDIINRQNKEKWPRTQDLKPLYEIDSGIFIASKRIYKENIDRIGEKPFLFKQDEIKSFDIDWDMDFKIAEAIYEKGLV